MKRHILVLSLVAAVFAGLAVKFLLRPNPHHEALRAREVATRELGEHLARAQSGKRVLVVSNPFTQRKGTAAEIVATEEAGVRGLRDGLGKVVVLGAVVYPALKPEAIDNPRAVAIDPETTTPLSYLVATDAFDKLHGSHPDCEIIVSLVGLPADLNACEVWQAADGPKFALLLPDLRMVGGATAVRKAMNSGKLLAFVLRKPGGVDDSHPLGKDIRAEFDRRFLLVTAENIEQITRSHPSLF